MAAKRKKPGKKKAVWVVYELDGKYGWFIPHFWDSDGDGGQQVYASVKEADMDYGVRPINASKGVYSLHPKDDDPRIVGILIKR